MISRRRLLKAFALAPVAGKASLLIDTKSPILHEMKWHSQYFDMGNFYGIAIEFMGVRQAVRIPVLNHGKISKREVVRAKRILIDWVADSRAIKAAIKNQR